MLIDDDAFVRGRRRWRHRLAKQPGETPALKMIIYQTPEGAGYNPLFPLSAVLRSRGCVFALSPANSSFNRQLARINIIVSVALVAFLSLSMATDQALSSTGMLFPIIVVLAWRSWSMLARRKEKITVNDRNYSKTFMIGLFTLEWSLVYFSISLFLLYVRAAGLPVLLDHSLAVLAGLSAAMIFLPFAQGSRYLLTKSRRS